MQVNFYIPSKGRPECRSFNMLRDQGVMPYIVVEPQDYSEYAELYGAANIIALPMDNQGIAYVRNFIKDFAIEQGDDWFFQVDDDITGFHKKQRNTTKRTNEKFIPKLIETLQSMPDDFAAVGIEYNQFAWAMKKPAINSYVEVFAGFRTSALKGVRYDDTVALKEDRDLILQLLSQGYKTIRFPDFAFSVPSLGSNKGGLQITYRSDKLAKSCQRMVDKWGRDICQLDLKDVNMPEVKINWRFFKA